MSKDPSRLRACLALVLLTALVQFSAAQEQPYAGRTPRVPRRRSDDDAAPGASANAAATHSVWPLPHAAAAPVRPELPPAEIASNRGFQESGVIPPPPVPPAGQGDASADDSLEAMSERIAKLEEALKDQGEAEAKAKAAAAKKPSMSITGRIHLDTWQFAEDDEGIGFFENPGSGADPENRLFFRRLRIGWQGEAFETMLYKMEFDFNEPSNPEIKDNYIGFQHLPIFQRVLIGNQKRPLGLDHWNSSRYNIFIERPLVVEAFNEDTRRLGICSYNVSDDEVFNWQYGAYLMENPVESGSVIGDSRQGSFNARLASSPWYDEPSDGRYYFHWAIAGMFARPDGDVLPTDSNPNLGRFRTRSEIRSDSRWLDTGPIAGAENYEILGLESIYNYGPLQVVAEYQNTWLQRDATTPGTGPDVMFHGAYVYLAYFLTGEHMTYERETGQLGRPSPFENFFVVRDSEGRICHGCGAWQVAIRYSYLDISDEDVLGGVGSNTTLALVWYFNPHASLQLNAVYGEIEEHEPVGGFTEGEFVALGARMRIDF